MSEEHDVEKITVPKETLHYVRGALSSAIAPCVAYDEDQIVMAHRALRESSRNLRDARGIIDEWLGIAEES